MMLKLGGFGLGQRKFRIWSRTGLLSFLTGGMVDKLQRRSYGIRFVVFVVLLISKKWACYTGSKLCSVTFSLSKTSNCHGIIAL